jgi:hypothetical protein
MPCMTRVPQDNERSKTPARSSTSMRRAHGKQSILQKQRLNGTIWTRWCLSSHHEHARMQRMSTHEKRDERACPHTPTRDANARACECAKHHGTQLSCSMSTHTWHTNNSSDHTAADATTTATLTAASTTAHGSDNGDIDNGTTTTQRH